MPKQLTAAHRSPAPKPARQRAAPRSARPSPPAELRPLFPIVGVGASAGGLDAFRQLLQALSAAPGIALILVPHLEPHHQSHLAELLARVTPLPIGEVADGMRVEPNRIYVLPAAFFIAIADGVLRLTPRAGKRLPIDFFLSTLAESHRERAVGVILSGTGSDGTLGLQAVRAAGGLAFAQEPSSAAHDGMPRSAIIAGAVDFVLPVEGIARELMRLGQRHPVSPERLVTGPADVGDGERWRKILLLLDRATGTDFSLYKRATLARRIARRMTTLGIDTLERYAQHLVDEPGEAKVLHQEFLISVTSFFRESVTAKIVCDKVLDLLRTRRSPSPPVRLWVAGCATGEEVYSLAICLLERAGELQSSSPTFQIFGTDLSQSIVAQARAGTYPESIAEQVSAERLERFFTKVDGHYQVRRTLRDLCVFARHDVTKDPPFSHVDVISCCNLLIYFEPRLQERVLAIFHYALNPGGLLLLGPSESAAAAPSLFEVLDKGHKIYVRKPTTGLPLLRFGARGRIRAGSRSAAVELPEPTAGRRPWAAREADRLLLAHYTPAGVIVDERLDILEFRGDTHPYLRHAQGDATLNLMKLVRKELYVELHQVIDEARKGAVPARREGLALRHQGAVRRVTLEVIPLPGPAESGSCMIVLFAAMEPGAGQGGAHRLPSPDVEDHQDGVDARVAQLEQELAASAEYLRTVLEDHESAYEELQAANEELLSANEEFQSLNEELETAKEEIQSTNEELATLNQELQDRNFQLGRLNDDLVNLLDSSTTAILMVDSALCLRRFTPMAEKLFHLRPADLGRSLATLPTNLAGGLEDEVRQVVESMSVQEREVSAADGSTFLLRIRPYHTHEKTIDGAVVVLFDISELKQVQRALESTAREREALLVLEQRARERAELADHIKDEFLATISHELRGPLQAMAGWAHILREDVDAGQLAKGLSAIERGVKTQLRLIEDLLDHSRIVAGQLHLNLREVDLAAIAELVLETVRLEGEAKSLHLELLPTAAAEPPPRIVGDSDRLQQVVLNLVNNAIKFTPAKGRITIWIGRVGDRLHLTVSDTGTGIRPDFLPHVFERFRQADAAANRRHQGLGLGLAIVRQLVELHGGAVSAESAGEGQGAKLTVALPIPPLLDRPLESALPASGSTLPLALALPSLGGLRVLVVEDDDDSREALAALLEQHGIRVVATASGAEAVASLDEVLPDLLVSDIGMPGMDGYDLIREVRRRSENRGGRLPALALTAYADPEDARRAFAAGFQMHLAKPVTPADLLRGMARLVGRADAS
ncbi:MAG TPA: chemotaxis protein CheB [Thermoanaerobaculia bacterium]|nr:chemotaxis protein CheB [Thermoanaerobaculia bacterium]